MSYAKRIAHLPTSPVGYLVALSIVAVLAFTLGVLAGGLQWNERRSRATGPASREVAATIPETVVGAPPSVHRLRPEQVLTLPPQIQEEVAGQVVQPAQALAPEDIVALPPQIQEEVRRTFGSASAMGPAETLRPESIMTLPPRIQDQVRGTPRRGSN